MKALLKVAAFILTFAGAIFLLEFVISVVLHKDADLLLHHGIGQLVFYALFILNVYAFQTFVNRESFLSLGLKPHPGWQMSFLKGWLTGILAFVLYTVLTKLVGVVDFQNRWTFERVATAWGVSFSAFGIATTEEILFRGFFFQTLLKQIQKWPAIIITGILFVLFHDLANMPAFWTVPKQMMLAGGLFCLNVLLCFAYLKSGSLYLPIAVHSGLVFAKVFFRKMKMVSIVEPNSYLFAIDGDARRGVAAWLFFLAGIFILKYLVSNPKKLNNIS